MVLYTSFIVNEKNCSLENYIILLRSFFFLGLIEYLKEHIFLRIGIISFLNFFCL